MFQRHCSDEQLLAYVDGELTRWSRARVARHLERCWSCRGRSEELESQAHSAARMLLDGGYPWAPRIGEAKQKFLVQRERFERTLVSAKAPPARTGFRSAWAISLSGAALAIVGILWLWTPSVPATAEVVTKARNAGESLLKRSTHQVFQLEVRQTRPVASSRSGRLEVWADGSGERFASRWTAPDGTLLHALWRPSEGDEYVLDSQNSPEPQRRSTHSPRLSPAALEQAGTDVQRPETIFMEWLETRDWRAIGFESGVLFLEGLDGAELTVSHCTEGGRRLLCLSGRRRKGAKEAEVLAQLDPVDYSLKLQTFRLKTAHRQIEFTLSAEKTETLPASLMPAVFQPPVLRATSGRVHPGLAPPELRQFESRSRAASPPLVSGNDVDLEYVLHQQGACLGNPVEVLPLPSSKFLVRGLVDTMDRRRRLEEALLAAVPHPRLRLEIQSEEDLKPAAQGRVKVADPETPANAAKTSSGTDFPARPSLEKFFRETKPNSVAADDDVRREVLQYSGRVVVLSQGVMREAWALRRLASTFRLRHDLTSRERALVRQMANDHLRGLRSQVYEAKALLEPVWGTGAGRQEAPDAAWSGLSWDEAVMKLFAESERLDAGIYAFFAPDRSPSNPDGTDPMRAISRVMSRFAQFDAGFRWSEEKIAVQFVGRTGNPDVPR